MAFFIESQEETLYRIHRTDANYEDVIAFLKGPYNDFLTQQIAPHAYENDRQEIFSEVNFRTLGELGFLSLAMPEAFGGSHAAFTYYNAGLESLSKADAGFALAVAIHGTVCDGILRFASAHQKERYLSDLVQGKKIASFALSEAGSGSDAKNMQTRYEFDSSRRRYILNGNKYWITNGLSANVFFVVARGLEGQMSAFLVTDPQSKTFTQSKIADKMGVRGSNTAELIFEDHSIPEDHLIGTEGSGFQYAMQMLNGGRITISAWATGIAQGAYEKLLKYSFERSLFRQKLKDLDNTKRELSEMLIEICASRNLSYAAAFAKSEGKDITQIAAMAKVKSTDTSVHVSERAIQLCGGYGYVQESRIERHLRDAMLGRIGEGANELLKIVVIPRKIFEHFETQPPGELW